MHSNSPWSAVQALPKVCTFPYLWGDCNAGLYFACHFQTSTSGLLLSQSVPDHICAWIRLLCPCAEFTLQLHKMSVDQSSSFSRSIRTEVLISSLIISSPSLPSSTNFFLSIQVTDEIIEAYRPQFHLFLAADQIPSYWLLLIRLSSLFNNMLMFSPNFLSLLAYLPKLNYPLSLDLGLAPPELWPSP